MNRLTGNTGCFLESSSIKITYPSFLPCSCLILKGPTKYGLSFLFPPKLLKFIVENKTLSPILNSGYLWILSHLFWLYSTASSTHFLAWECGESSICLKYKAVGCMCGSFSFMVFMGILGIHPLSKIYGAYFVEEFLLLL